jgi:hypothetical protein
MLTLFGGGGYERCDFDFTPRVKISPPSDFHMFGPMREAIRGRRFSSDEEVTGAVKNWLKTQPKKLFSD